MGLRLTAELEASVSPSLEVSDFVSDAGGFETMAATLELLFSQDELGTYLIELGVELALGVIEVLVSLDLGDVPPAVELGNGGAEGVEGRGRTVEEEEEPGGHGLDWSVEIVGGVCVELYDIWYLIMVLPGEELHLAVVSLTNPLGWTCVARANQDGGGNLSCIGDKVVGAEGVLVVMGDLGFERSNFFLELLICASECIGFKAVNGIVMLNGD